MGKDVLGFSRPDSTFAIDLSAIIAIEVTPTGATAHTIGGPIPLDPANAKMVLGEWKKHVAGERP